MKITVFTAAALLLTATPVFAAETPEALVESVYNEGQAVIDPAKLPRYYAVDMAAALAEDQRAEDAGVGFDWLYGAQDAEIEGLTFKQEAVPPDRAQVQVNFTNFGQPVEIYWLLCKRPNGDWRIDNVMTMEWSLREMLGLGPDGEC